MSNTSQNLAQQLPKIPIDDDGPVFAEPWQAQVFAVTLNLHDKGAFSWPEWVQYFSAELKRAEAEPESGDVAQNYYLHWLSALEKMLDEKCIVESRERENCKSAWDKAARNTPHGQPIVLG